MTWTHPYKSRWRCVEHPEIVIRLTRVRGFHGNLYQIRRGDVWLGSAFSLDEAKILARLQ